MRPRPFLLLAGVALALMAAGEADAGKEPEWSYDTGWWLDSVAISADGEYIAAGAGAVPPGSSQETLYLFDKDSSTPLWNYTTGERVRTVSISADGEYIAAGSDDNKVYISDKDTGPVIDFDLEGDVLSVAISADGEYIAAGGFNDQKVYLFDKDSSTPLWSYTTGDDVYSVAISADGEYIAAGSADGKVYLFDKDSSTPLWSYITGDDVYSVAISADGEYIVAGNGHWDENSCKIYLFDKDSSTPLWNYTAGDDVLSVSISADGEYVTAGSRDNKVYLFDKDSSTPIWNYDTGDAVLSVSISADGEYIAAGGLSGEVYLFGKDSGTPLWNYTPGGEVYSVSISADGAYIAAGGQDGKVYLFDKNIPPINVTFTVDARNGTDPASYTCADMDGDDSVENCMLSANFSLPSDSGASWDHPHFWQWMLYSEGVVIQHGDLAELTLNDVNLTFSWVAEGCTTFECQNTTVHQNTHRGAYYLRPTDCVWFQNPGVSQFEDGFDNNNTWRCFNEVGDYPSGNMIFHVTEEPTECEIWEQENPYLVDRAKPEGEMDNGCPCYGTGDETCDDDEYFDEQELNNTSSNDNGTITVSVARVDIPEHPEWSWTYKYSVEVGDLQMDVNYTAVILVKRVGDDEWGGLDWWWDIDWEGGYDEDNDGYQNQIENPFSLQRGCYHINAGLYERDDLYADAENAAVLVAVDLDFGVGGICMDGVFYPEVDSDADGVVDYQDYCPDTSQGEMVDVEGCSETQLSGTGEGGDDGDGNVIEEDDGGGIPAPSLAAAVAAVAVIALHRRPRNT